MYCNGASKDYDLATWQQNDVAECMNRTILDMERLQGFMLDSLNNSRYRL